MDFIKLILGTYSAVKMNCVPAIEVSYQICVSRSGTCSRETTSPMADRCLVGFLAAALGVVSGFCFGIVIEGCQ